MATKNTARSLGHLLSRLIGLTGAMAALGGAFWWQYVSDEEGRTITWIGAGMVAFALLIELAAVARTMGSRRGAVGSNVILQTLLAAVLLVGVNAFSFHYYQRFDLTRNRDFTLDAALRDQLRKLQTDTTIIVFQKHSTFGAGQAQDYYLAAAERKIVEKVLDLVEQFQDVGPRFHVEFLDIQDKGFEAKLKALRRKSDALADAIQTAPENSIFFFVPKGGAAAKERVQRLSFHDIYQLDRKASEEADGQRGNLVLNYQGPEPFANKILNIEEKRPRVAIGVIHEYLGVDSKEDMYGMGGVKKALASRGFDGRDIILKLWPGARPGVLTYEENEYERLEIQLANTELDIDDLQKRKKFWTEEKRFWESSSLEEINKKYALVPVIRGIFRRLEPVEIAELEAARKKGERIPPLSRVTEPIKREWIAEIIDDLAGYEEGLQRSTERRAQLRERMAKLPVEDLAEKRRIADLKTKFTRMLADVDLLILPRMTLFNAIRDERIGNRLYRLDDGQVEAVRDFIKKGKAVLFLLGPSNEPAEDFDPSGLGGPDRIEEILADLGFKLPKQTILFESESEVVAERQAKVDLLGSQGEVPPAAFDWKPGAGLSKQQAKFGSGARQPIRTSLRLATSGAKDGNDVRLRNPRPVYYAAWRLPPEAAAVATGLLANPFGFGAAAALPYLQAQGAETVDEKTIFLMTSADCWNEDQPFVTENKIPKFERPKADDPNRGTLNAERKGPFPIGVAVEAKVPAAWYGEDRPATTPSVRIAVVGHGGVFIAPTLNAAKEKLLLDTCNWLLGRDDLLAKDHITWSFPRVSLDATEQPLWKWGAGLGLPLVFVYLGLAMWLVRRMR